MAEVPSSQNARAKHHLWLQQGDTGDETKDEATPELMLKLSTIEALKIFYNCPLCNVLFLVGSRKKRGREKKQECLRLRLKEATERETERERIYYFL